MDHVITGNLKIISDSQIRSVIERVLNVGFLCKLIYKSVTKNCTSLNECCNRWCKREHVECDALKDWKSNIFKIKDRLISV